MQSNLPYSRFVYLSHTFAHYVTLTTTGQIQCKFLLHRAPTLLSVCVPRRLQACVSSWAFLSPAYVIVIVIAPGFLGIMHHGRVRMHLDLFCNMRWRIEQIDESGY